MISSMTMNSISPAASRPSRTVLTGRVLSGIGTAFLLFDVSMKLFPMQQAIDATVKLGYSAGVLQPLGVILLICLTLYLIPRTAIIGAILMTGYLGGAVATHVRANGSAFEITFPLIFASILWGGLYLRDARVSAMLAPAGTNN